MSFFAIIGSMKNFLAALFCGILLCAISLFFSLPQSFSEDDVDKISKQISDLTNALNMSKAATAPLETELTHMRNQISDIKVHVSNLERDINDKKKIIYKGYENLAKQQEILNKAIRDMYIKNYYNSPFLVFLSAPSASEVTQALAYQKAAADQDKTIITNIALSIQDLETKKINLENEQKRLAGVKVSLDEQSAKLDEIVQGAKAYQKDVSSKIADLSAKQQEIINARSGSFTVTIGDSELADDYNASIKGFREAAPSGSFAVFSFGAHTHRKGMSQYGAFGRAQAGQDYKAILRAYYGKEPVSKDTAGTIKVSGFGEMDFEGRYLLGIAEMPSNWHKEALKAQAVAARTYAYRYKTGGQEICTNEACQVYNSGKADNPPDAWRQAVDETRGQVLEDITTFYSSTTGGYVGSMWDTTDGNGGSNLFDKAYERMAGSPWFYKAWYTKGYSSSSDKCGRSNPWLSSGDIADIINAASVLYGSGSGADTGRITPTTTSCWGGNPYSQDDLRSVSGSYGGGVGSVSGVTVMQGTGVTNEVVFQTDKGEKRLSGTNFKSAFNLRASGYLSIPQSGFAFFNIEKK